MLANLDSTQGFSKISLKKILFDVKRSSILYCICNRLLLTKNSMKNCKTFYPLLSPTYALMRSSKLLNNSDNIKYCKKKFCEINLVFKRLNSSFLSYLNLNHNNEILCSWLNRAQAKISLTCLLPGVDYTKVLLKALAHSYPKRAKKTVNLTLMFPLFGSGRLKGVRKTFMKFTPVCDEFQSYKAQNSF